MKDLNEVSRHVYSSPPPPVTSAKKEEEKKKLVPKLIYTNNPVYTEILPSKT